jgi:hypothetical protein
MIQVQIATRLTPTGVSDVRWVLVDPSELPGGKELAMALAPTGPAPLQAWEPGTSRESRWWVRPLQVTVIAAAFGGAWWVADHMIATTHSGAAPAVGRSAG